MSFNPKDFLAVADELRSGSSEAHYRSIVNRYYYGIYGHLAKKYNPGRGISTHQNLIDKLKFSSDRNQKKIGKYLEQFFNKRKDADYEFDIIINIEAVKFSKNTSQVILDLIDG